jgi:hypothetical protein
MDCGVPAARGPANFIDGSLDGTSAALVGVRLIDDGPGVQLPREPGAFAPISSTFSRSWSRPMRSGAGHSGAGAGLIRWMCLTMRSKNSVIVRRNSQAFSARVHARLRSWLGPVSYPGNDPKDQSKWENPGRYQADLKRLGVEHLVAAAQW